MTKAAGQLKCKQLVHMLSPQNSDECSIRIVEALNLVDTMGFNSLSIPFIGAGGSELQLDNVTMVACVTFSVVIIVRKGSIDNIKLIRLVGFTSAKKALFKNMLYEAIKFDFSELEISPPNVVADNIPAGPISPSSSTEAPNDYPLSVASASKSHAPASHTPTLSTKINAVSFEVALGDITDEKTDAIVNPTDDELQLNGELSKAIVSKGGSVITQECRKRGSIPAGGTVVTTGGALSCRHVVHVEAPDDLQKCERAVHAVIQSAVANKFKSISFPPIGAGGKGLPLNSVAGCIVDALADAAKQDNTESLTLVRLVCFTGPGNAAFEAALTSAIEGKRNLSSALSNSSNTLDSDSDSDITLDSETNLIVPLDSDSDSDITLDSETNLIVPSANPATSSNTTQPVTAASQSANSCTLINGIRIEVLQGDVTDESTDAIVNPTDEDMELTGNLSQAILAKGGQSIKNECKAIGTLKDVTLTSAGSLKCHHILHALSPYNITDCKTVMPAILRLCASKQFKSISIPLIGASRGKPLDQMAACITDEVATEARNGTLGSTNLVRLVGFNQKEKDAFEGALKLSAANTSEPIASTKVQPSSPSKLAIQSSTNGSVINGVLVEILQGDITNESTEAVVNPTDEDLELTGSLSRALIAKGGDLIAEECKAIGKLNDVAITSAGTGSLQCHQIIHILSPGNINACQQVLRTLLSTVAAKGIGSVAIPPIGVSRGIPLQHVAGCITDEIASEARGKTLGILRHVRLVGFNQSEKDALEKALKLSAAETSALDAANRNSSSAPIADAKNPLAVSLPVTWAPMDENERWSKVLMQQSDADYEEALKLFTLEEKTPQKIYRIQNPTFYKQYQLEKNEMEKQYEYAGKTLTGGIERRLYHGTEEAIVPKICSKGIDRSYCGKNGVYYGRGSYFARDMNYSADDSYSKPNPETGEKFIFAVRVLVGVYQEHEGQLVPDAQPSGEPYDATVDNAAEPTIFVIYRDQRAYPEFLYVFI